jgi:hypothetical protein
MGLLNYPHILQESGQMGTVGETAAIASPLAIGESIAKQPPPIRGLF